MRIRFIPLLLAVVLSAAMFTACGEQDGATADFEAVNRVYPEGEGNFYGATPEEAVSPDGTAADSTSDPKGASGKSAQATTAPKAASGAAAASTPNNTVTSDSINPNLPSIQQQMAGQADAVSVESISLSETSLSLEVGESQEIEIIYNPSDATNKTVTLVTDNINADVEALGRTITITGSKAGTCTLTVISHNGHRATCDITIRHAAATDVNDDTVLPHKELVTVENAERWTNEVIDRLETLGLTRNTGLQGESFRLVTDQEDNKSYNDAALSFASQADYQTTTLTNGDYHDYQFNCVCMAQGNGEFAIVVVIRS